MKISLGQKLDRISRRLIIGDDQYIESHSEFKQAMLSGQFAVIGVITCLLLAFVELLDGNYLPLFIYALTVSLLGISLYFHRIGKHCTANYFLFGPVSVAAFLLVTSEAPETGGFVHFIPITLGAFIIFGYRFRKLAVIIVALSMAGLMGAYLANISILPYRHYTPEQIVAFRIVNLVTAVIVSAIAVNLLLYLNHKNAARLMDNFAYLSKTNAELDRFVYSTSHDLRAPLNSILGLLNIVELTTCPKQRAEYMSLMRGRIGVLDNFIKDITAYSRNSRLELSRQKIHLSGFIADIWEMLRYTKEAENVQFEMDIPDDVVIESDINRLKTVLLNLVSNALRYHDKSKDNQFIRLRYVVNGKGFHIKVEDNGQGIAQEYHQRIFDMFFRANDSASGSGLGLYIVRETVSKLSGTIQLESTPGLGSVFTIKLPG